MWVKYECAFYRIHFRPFWIAFHPMERSVRDRLFLMLVTLSLVSAKEKKMSLSHERLCLSIDVRVFPACFFFQSPGCEGWLIGLHSWEKNVRLFFFFSQVHWTTFVMQGLCLDWVTKVTGIFSRNGRAQSIEHLQMTFLSKPHLKGEFRNKLKVAF